MSETDVGLRQKIATGIGHGVDRHACHGGPLPIRHRQPHGEREDNERCRCKKRRSTDTLTVTARVPPCEERTNPSWLARRILKRSHKASLKIRRRLNDLQTGQHPLCLKERLIFAAATVALLDMLSHAHGLGAA